jgi:hypothetical protein
MCDSALENYRTLPIVTALCQLNCSYLLSIARALISIGSHESAKVFRPFLVVELDTSIQERLTDLRNAAPFLFSDPLELLFEFRAYSK